MFLPFVTFLKSSTLSLFCSTIGKVDETMNQVNEQIEHANEIGEALATPLGGTALDEVSFFLCVW